MSKTTIAPTVPRISRQPLHFTSWSARTAALVAGVALALMAVLAGFGNFGVLVPLITPGDAAKTAQDISAAPLLFFTGVASMFLVTLLDIIVAGALYTLFKPVSRRLSAAAAWARAVYALLFMGAIGPLVIGFTLLDNPEAALPVLESFNTLWVISQGLFGASLLLVGYLAFRSAFVAKVFGILLAVAGVGYLADAVGMAVIPGFTAFFAQFVFVGEVVFIFWLLIRGRSLSASRTAG